MYTYLCICTLLFNIGQYTAMCTDCSDVFFLHFIFDHCVQGDGAGDTAADIEEELGLAGAVAEDAEAEYIRRITETELLSGANLLGVLRPHVVAVCSNSAKYSDPELQAAAAVALAKFMMVRLVSSSSS